MKKRFSLNLFGPITAITTWALVGYLIFEMGLLTSSNIKSLTLTPNSIVMTIFLLSFCVLAGLIPTWSVIREKFTFFTSEEIRQPKIIGTKTIKWIEVVEVAEVRFSLHIKSKSERIVLSLAMYKKPQEMVT